MTTQENEHSYPTPPGADEGAEGLGAPAPGALSRRCLLRGTAAGAAVAALSGGGLVTPAATSAAPTLHRPRKGRLREYWVQADSFFHNLVPTGRDGMMGTRYTPNETSYWALGYRAYTPGWKAPLVGNDHIGPNTGIPGPLIRAQVGDTIRVHFRNNDRHYRFPHSMHPHGVTYTPPNDGPWYALDPHKPGAAVKPDETYTYEWRAVPSSVGTWVYHDHSMAASIGEKDPVMELSAQLGLFGLIAVTDDTTPPVDREFYLFFHDLYHDDVQQVAQDIDCFNGRAFLGNTPTFTARVGQRVRWRIGALGKEFHVFHLHGHRWRAAGQWVDTQVFGPATTLTVEYTEDNPGTWLYHCHVTDHMAGGMVGFYEVTR